MPCKYRSRRVSVYTWRRNCLQRCGGTWLRRDEPGGVHKNPLHPTHRAAPVPTQAQRCKQLEKGRNTQAGEKGHATTAASTSPRLIYKLSWKNQGKSKGRLWRNIKRWDVPPLLGYERLFQTTAVFYKADLKIGIFLLLREFVHFIFLLAKVLLLLFIPANPAEPPQHWGGEPESILA